MAVILTPLQKRAQVKLPNREYNYTFDRKTGFFMRWGKTPDDDPDFSPVGPEIADIEISTICHQNCPWCYKSNTAQGKNMTFEQFKEIFHKLPPYVCQIAFGIGSIDANPDLWQIMHYCRDNAVVPNITINGYRMKSGDCSDWVELARVCGAVAVSNYDKDICYGAVQKLADRILYNFEDETLCQVNIHQLLCENTYNKCMELLDDAKNDVRLSHLNAVVFLIMKPKGKRNHFQQLKDMTKYRALIDKAFALNVPIGFDSCTAPSFLRAVKDHPNYKQLKQIAEPCESTCFSIYIDVEGKAWPCSFSAGEPGIEPIDLKTTNNFLRDVWYSPQFRDFRGKLLASQCQNGCRQCPIYDLEIT